MSTRLHIDKETNKALRILAVLWEVSAQEALRRIVAQALQAAQEEAKL